ncbi:hypothetical protein RV11_GL002478 [Enterococcus phoeniculicola]|jgi:putative ABC transport system permease protein|uniref:ABC3 transporter permease C-terminal domain-containing protein n=1 Tax=Enterococcus phoeniculicola ATCC BAA-412 TaxID=1158610 RepID=R3TT17_9ENTE|nr:ABC transporter permease [Enterococcus phoeniculicola]EOL44729.1 hypothetical protein UC3_01546 [Enterococcus phoeniculicola ATCC BAA-412]EOT75018.1 hypothetical protein I589_02618 [Enterococcus phoeniculicola ATCC BAA-412]OJG72904.1 hypothetical protein RV11_GL002478 [Enterococcus phoeniculicola]
MFYLKLSWNNLKKNKTTYLPFLLSMIFLVILNLLMQVMIGNKGMQTIPRAATVQSIFGFGNNVVMIFSLIFAFYTNSFLIKQRKKELGLYNILGLGKSSLGFMLFVETMLSMVIVLITGIMSGTIFSKFLFLVMKKMTGFGEDFVFQLSTTMFVSVFILFAGIFAILFFYNFIQVIKTNPIELLHGGQTGEKEPKSRWILSLAGVGLLGTGYYLSLTIQSPVEAIQIFFLAIVFVIVGTYLLAITGSVTLLKFLKNRKNYYYNPKHFVNVSGMIYRMKQNGAGLASICILCTMVLVTVSSTAGLYFGKENVLRGRNPFDASITTQGKVPEIQETFETLAKKNHLEVTKSFYLELPSSIGVIKKGTTVIPMKQGEMNFSSFALLQFIPLDEYNRLTGEKQTISENEVLVYGVAGEFEGEEIQFPETTVKIKQRIKTINFLPSIAAISQAFLIVTPSSEISNQLIKQIELPENYEKSIQLQSEMAGDFKGTQENRMAFIQAMEKYTKQLNQPERTDLPKPSMAYAEFSSIDMDRLETNAFVGGFLFIGLIFGLSFTLATALIIYYKQISEGYSDARRFEIMQKVGMSHKEVRQTIVSQILMVFLFPITLAAIHLAFALPIIRKILVLFGLTDNQLITIVTVISVVLFTACYLLVYLFTSKVYYRIVERK